MPTIVSLYTSEKHLRLCLVGEEEECIVLEDTRRDGHVSLAERAYRYIEEQIVTLKLKPGDIIADKSIAEGLGISRTPVREAILRLRNEQFVESSARRGVFVLGIDLAHYKDIFETRRVLDNLLLETASYRATAPHIDDLADCAAEMTEAAGRHDVENFMRADRRFDQIVADAARMLPASKSVMPLHSHCRRFWYAYKKSQDLRTSAEFHVAIMTALGRRDATEAINQNNALIDHLVHLLRKVLDE